MKELRFALGYVPHRLWGNLLQAQFLEKEPGKEFFTPAEHIHHEISTSAIRRLSPMQREVVQLMDAYSDRNLHKLFSRKKTVKQFQDSVDEATIRDHIRPYIEKYLHKILEIARDNRFSLFIQGKHERNIFPEDFIHMEKEPAEPLFIFQFAGQLSYALHLTHLHKRLKLNEGFTEIICNTPAVILLDRSIYFINDIDGKKLKPFLVKERVEIPAGVEQKYFSTFVRKTLRDYHTLTEGFTVETPDVRPEAELILERGLDNKPVWILALHYKGHVIAADSKLKRFVDYTSQGGRHHFEQIDRDQVWEEEVIRILQEHGFNSRDNKLFHLKKTFIEDDENSLYSAINFINSNGPSLTEAGIRIRHRLKENYFLGEITLKIESGEHQDWFDIYGEICFGEHRVPFLALRKHILNGIREYPLPGGELAILPEEWFARYQAMFEFGKAEGKRILIHKQHFSMVEGPVRDFHAETLKKLEKLNRLQSLPSAPLPLGLHAELRDYQMEGFKWLSFLKENGFGGCLADDMGLGKTLQAIAILLKSKADGTGLTTPNAGQDVPTREGQLSLFGENHKQFTSLIVVPASLLHNWSRECRRFAPGLKLLEHVGNQRNRDLSNFPYYDLVVSTYHTVRQDILRFSAFHFDYIILDESQMIKNPFSKLYQAMVELRSEHKIVLTGTPIENSLTDLWSQINFINPGLLGPLSFFKRSFVQPIEKREDEQREEKLKELINPFILRRTKQEVARELPPILEQIRYCNMTESQRSIYEEEKSQARNSILENLHEVGLERSSIIVLQALTRLRQIANHPAMMDDMKEIDSGKFFEVYRDIQSVVSEGHKVLMFSSFVKHLEIFREQLERDRLGYAYLTGSHNRKQREGAIAAFQEEAACKLFLLSLKAGGVGLNLTAADYVFILDPWWNPAAEIQALSRAHRIGQEKKIFVYRFISTGTIEEKILLLQERKKKLAETFIFSNNPLKNLSEKEMLELFS